MLLGADPEVFITDQFGVIVSAGGRIGGTKAHPRKVVGGGLQEDNVMAELNPDPGKTRQEFVHNVTTIMRSLRALVYKEWGEGFCVGTNSSGTITNLQSMFPSARIFGCEADFNGWSEKENPRIILHTNDRFCGGHIHLEDGSLGTEEDQINIVRLLDLFLGVPSVILDKDNKRYTVYGKAGQFRYKPAYPGVEYRTLSNFWIHNIVYINWVWDSVYRAVDAHKDGFVLKSELGNTIQSCINTQNALEAENLMHIFRIEVPL